MTKRSTTKPAAAKKPTAKKFTPASAVPFVKLFQQTMMDHGHDLPQHGADGLFGPETSGVFSDFMRDKHKLRVERQSLIAAVRQLDAENEAQKKLNDALETELREAKDRLSYGESTVNLLAAAVGGAAAAIAAMWVALALGLV